MKQFVLFKYLIRIDTARDGWWIMDKNGFKHYLPFSIQRIESPDGLMAWRITAWQLNIEIGKIPN